MIKRIVLIKLNDAWATPERRQEVAAYAAQALGEVPQVRGAVAGVPAEATSAASWDVSILLDFDSVEDVDAYKVHPLHRAFVDEYLAPRRAVLKAWSFDLG